MKLIKVIAQTLLVSGFALGRPVAADVVWNESNDGDLSSTPATPTALTFLTGSNTVIGSLSEPDGDLRDFMTFTIAPGQFLTALTLDAFVADGPGFQGINSGSTGLTPGEDPEGDFLGLEFTANSYIGLDMLESLGDGLFGSMGFPVPLGPGTYSYVIQEITPGQTTSYQLSFHMIPEPASAGIVAVAGMLLAVRRRRR